MRMCLCVYTSMCAHVYPRTLKCVRMHVRVPVCAHVRTSTRTAACVHTRECVYGLLCDCTPECVRVHTCITRVCVCAHTCACVCVCMHEMARPPRSHWKGHFCALHHGGSWPPAGTRSSTSPPWPRAPHVPGGSPPCLPSPPLAPSAPRDGFFHTVLMTRSSRLALIRFHKTSPAASSGSVITISFRFKETRIFPFSNLTEHFTL